MGTDHSPTSATGAPVAISDRVILFIVAGYALAFVLFGLLIDTPAEILQGLGLILSSRDTLLTDYIGVGGIGAALVSAGLLTLAATLVYALNRVRMTGTAIAALFLVLGFGLFGKNLLNVWPIIAGVALYARWRRQSFATHINTAFFGIALSPIVSEILFSTTLPLGISLPLAISTGLLIGFILPAAAAQLFRAHDGFALYNMGFTAGLVGTLVVALYMSYGFVAQPVFIWTSGNDLLLGSFVGALLLSMVLLGVAFDRRAFSGFWQLMRLSGQAPSDFLASAGLGATLVNMGLSGAVGLAYILAVGGDLNGPTIGALLSIVGFAAFGKHPRNIVPIMAGVFLGSLAKPWGVADPSILLAALFATNLAPIAGHFGWHWGVAAGFIHSSAALSVGAVHGGLNLYNNGFAAGIVASILVPVIIAIRARRREGVTRANTRRLGQGPAEDAAPTTIPMTNGAAAPALAPSQARVGSAPGLRSERLGSGGAEPGSRAVTRLGLGRWLGSVLGRGLFFLGFWLLLSSPDLDGLSADPLAALADAVIALAAVALATWVSIRLWPPGPRAPRTGAMLALTWRFLEQSVLGGVDVARRAFDPRLPLKPGFLAFPAKIRTQPRLAVFATLTSATPGTMAAGRNAEGALVYHCLDTRLPVLDGLAEDERLLRRAFGDDCLVHGGDQDLDPDLGPAPDPALDHTGRA
jgi:multisubunit Na+/H+ antiporter MnhE subunit